MSLCDVDFSDASEDAESCEFYTSRLVKARKEHTCDECDGKIHVGETYERRAYRFEGDFNSELSCPSCVEVAGEFDFRVVGGLLWSQFEDQWDNGSPLQACLNRLTTVRAKTTMREQWQKWQEKRWQQQTSQDAR